MGDVKWWLSLVLQTLIVVHAVDDREVVLNTRAIASFSRPGVSFHDDANCIVTLLDGKFLPIKETCRQLINLIAQAPSGGYLDGK